MMASYAPRNHALATWLGILFALYCATQAAATLPEDAQWIWSATHKHQDVPQGECYFRKKFSMANPEQGQILITCDDRYELYVNGHHVGSGKDWKRLDEYDITRYLVAGDNVVAIKAINQSRGSAGLVAQVVVKQQGHTHVAYPTDTSWKTNLEEVPNWTTAIDGDAQWQSARTFGHFGTALPWGDQAELAVQYGRFRTLPGFAVEWVISPEETDSLIAVTFNEFGQIIASREGGPLLLISDTDKDGVHETVTTYCDEVKNCQGLLAINGGLMVVGDGPQGAALYRLDDNDRNGQVESVEVIQRFKGAMIEHGPHALILGPDGLIYLIVGNHGSPESEYASTSPYRNSYEGDLIQPRYEDPGGHAAGIKVPGGTILRTDANGSFLELVAGGLRNPYDIAFNREGDLFTYDADMESDIGTPWYRPTRINHVTPGAELGWRSGWAKWPEYYLDSLPGILDMGPGSPSGIEFYNHVMYPIRYHNALFACDWSRGRINVVRMQKSGATYRAKSEVFVQGKPLNVTDIAVGPDGWVYFCTGGRGTAGGIFRVIWNGHVPPEMTKLGTGIQRAIRQPQLQSAWARQRIAQIQEELGDAWDIELAQLARNAGYSTAHRIRAMDLLQLFGPSPSPGLLLDLSRDRNALIRTKAAYLMGIQGDNTTAARLVAMLGDADPSVRRTACEALVRFGHDAPVSRLIQMLADPDRFVAYAARRAVERRPSEQWESLVLRHESARIFLQGSTAVLAAHPGRHVSRRILDRCIRMMRGDVRVSGRPPGFLSDEDFTDLLRVIQLALIRGKLLGEDVPALRRQLAQEYPSQDKIMNRELAQILVYLDDPSIARIFIEQLSSDLPLADKIHLGMMAPTLKRGWTTDHKLALLRFYEKARRAKGGQSLQRYIDTASRRFAENLNEDERLQVLAGGVEWPSAALAVLTKLPRDPGKATLRQIRQLDQQLTRVEGEAAGRLRIGIVAVLGRSRDQHAMAYLRDVYARDPSRREAVAMGLAQYPVGENWPLLVRSLAVLDGVSAREVLSQLGKVKRKPRNPETIRQAILCGLRTKEHAAPQAVKLLTKWTGEQVSQKDDRWDLALAKWQEWFQQKYPEQPEPLLPKDPENSKWTYEELLSFLEGPQGKQGDPHRGGIAFQRAQCAKCHRYGNRGQRFGPDLTTISRRFHTKEILESLLFPSHVISDQYASKMVVTKGGRSFTGIVVESTADSIVLLDSNADSVEISTDDIEETVSHKKSVMPDGLLNTLTLEQIADLFAYMTRPPRTIVTSRRQVKSNR